MEIRIGDIFTNQGKHPKKHEVVDIIKQFSTARNEWCGVKYIAKGIDTLASNTFEVSKTTILRGKV